MSEIDWCYAAKAATDPPQALGGLYFCTLAPGHKGPHIAHLGGTGEAVNSWLQDSPPIAKKGDTLYVNLFTPLIVDVNDPNVRCDKCRFWLPHDLAPCCLGGECRRLSPLAKTDAGMNTPAFWPETESEDKCGEFSPRLVVLKSSSPIPPPDLANKP